MHRSGLALSVTLFANLVVGCSQGPSTRPQRAATWSQPPTFVTQDEHQRRIEQAASNADWPSRLAGHSHPSVGTVEELPSQAEVGDLELSELIRLASQANPDIRSSLERINIADATLAGAAAEFYPRVVLGENYGVSNNPVNAFSFQLNQGNLTFNQDFNNPATIDNFHTQVLVQQNVYAGGRRIAEQRSAAAQREAAMWGRQEVQNQLVFRVAEAYYRLIQARDLIRVREESVRQIAQHLEVVQTRVRAETAVKSDVLSVQVQLAETRESLISAQNRFELAWAVLNNVVGTTVDRRTLPQRVPVVPWGDRTDELQAMIAEATSRRPEVAGLHNQQNAAAAQVEAARAGKRLQVDAVADYDVYTGDFSDGNDSFFAGLVIQWALFDGGRTHSQVDQAAARLRELKAQHQKLVLDIELDVRRASLQLNDAEERSKVASTAVQQAVESLREIEVQYGAGESTITRLIDAQVALSNARVRKTNAAAEIQIARTSLARSVGRLSGIVNH